jgi:phosphoglycerate dehydrogenase-like enzyme
VALMRLLLSSRASLRYGSSLAKDDVDLLTMSGDGTLLLADGQAVDWPSAEPEVAWGTSDLYLDDGPLRPFFGLLRRATSLRWFQSSAAGFDAPIFAELAGRGVRICNSHANSIPIAEFVLRAVLDRFQQADRWRLDQQHARWDPHNFRELHGSTWLVIGLGGIGSAVAIRARAFGARVIGCRRQPRGDEPVDVFVSPADLNGAVDSADVVVVAAPADASTHRLIDAGFLALMKPGSILVNVSRGSLVDQEALLASLDRGIPDLAVLDVFDAEPLPADHPFWTHPSVVVTPHNAALGEGRYQRQAHLFQLNLDRYLAGQPLLNDVTEAVYDVHRKE